MIEKNIESLNKRYPQFIVPKDLKNKYIITKSKNGDPTATLDGVYIHSKYDPVKEAKKVLLDQVTSDLIVIAGFGLGYITEEATKMYPDKLIIVYEPSLELFVDAMNYRDLSFILSKPNIYYLVGESPEVIKDFFTSRMVNKIAYIPLPNRIKMDYELFSSVEESIRLYLSRIKINRNTLLKFGKLWVKNQSKNLPLMAYKGDISEIYGKFNNIPGIIIAAGPSMELIIPHLKKIKDSFVILTVDTAVKSLIEEGIEPDFVMSIDSQYWNARHLEGLNTEKTLLIADSSIQPSALRSFEDRVYFTSSTFPLGQYFESQREPFSKIASGGSVSTNIWDFAINLGLKEIFFIGQDLGFPGGITHYKNSYFEKNMLISSNKLNPLENQSFHYIYDGYPTSVISNSNNSIISDKRMAIYIDWFKEKLKLNNISNCFNLSLDGCKIEGMPYKDINEILNYSSRRDTINTILSNLNHRDNNFYLPSLLKAAQEFKEKLLEVVLLGEKSIKLCNIIESDYKNRNTVQKNLDKLTKLDNTIMQLNHSKTLSFIIEPFIKDITDSTHSTALDALLVSKVLYKKITATGKLHIKHLEQSINKMKTSLK